MKRSTVLTATADVTATDTRASRTPRCTHTMLTKPECHCRACLSEQISAYGMRAGLGHGPQPAHSSP